MAEGRIYTLNELLAEVDESKPLIEGLLWERDNVFIVGHEKAGKSILGMQIAFALTSGQALFGEFNVMRKCTVLYVQTEGKLSETKDRTSQMMKVNDVDNEKYFLAYEPSIALDTIDGYERFVKKINDRGIKPDVIILDPLYHSMSGSMIDEQDSRKMTVNLRRLSDLYDATIIVVHHTHKPIRSREGDLIDEGDNAIFGSFVFKAWADHILLFKKVKDKTRILSCDTQRSGKVMGREELYLVGEPYLSFERKSDENKPYELTVRKTIEKAEGGITRVELMTVTNLSASAVDKSVRKLIKAGEVEKVPGGYPVKYRVRAEPCPPAEPKSVPVQRVQT